MRRDKAARERERDMQGKNRKTGMCERGGGIYRGWQGYFAAFEFQTVVLSRSKVIDAGWVAGAAATEMLLTLFACSRSCFVRRPNALPSES